MLPSPKQTPLRVHPPPCSAPRGPSFHSMHSQLKRIYTNDVLSVICGWRALAVTRGGTKSQGRGGWAGGCPPTTGAHSWAPRHFPCTGCPGGSPNELTEQRGQAMTPRALLLLLLLGALGASVTRGKSGLQRGVTGPRSWMGTMASLSTLLLQAPGARRRRADSVRNFSWAMTAP